ncbi:MAG: sigma 54-interacting transcriptional regulator [Thermodesulfobacteriota bacterium]
MKPHERPGGSFARAGAADETRLHLLYELGCAFAERTDLDELIPLVVAKCRDVLAAHGAAVLLLDPSTNELYFPYVAQERPSVAQELLRTRFPSHLGHAGAVLRSGKSSRLDDASAEPQFYRQIDLRTRSRTGPMITVPLTTRQGRIGVIQVVNQRGGRRFTDDDLWFLETLAASVAVAIENARLYARMRASQETLREEVATLRQDLALQDRFPEIVGSGTAMREVIRLMERAAASPIAVLIEGETGTGKELVARGIHNASPRAGRPFLPINCGALPEHLLESELFGHRRGAFTGAHQDRIGLFESAAGGTILLDEVGDMPPAMQVKLLRVLQENEIVPVGDTRARKVDVRILSATHRDVETLVGSGTFREDLYYRLAAFPIHLPPLRERPEDIPALVAHLLGTISARRGRDAIGIDPAALDCLTRFPWPGNVRELQNEIERAVALLGSDDRVRTEHLSTKLVATANGGPPVEQPARAAARPLRGPDGLAAVPEPAAAAADPAGEPAHGPVQPLRAARAAFEERYIEQVLSAHAGNVSRAAAALGLSRAMLHKRLRASRRG